MTIKGAIFCGCLMLAGAGPARAFLGDDFQAIAGHYGKPIHSLTRPDGSQPMVYDCEGFRILVEFEDSRSVSETFTRLDRLTPFSEETLRAFLDVHSAGKLWRETERIPGQRGWQRTGALALYDERSLRPTLIISSIGYTPVDVTGSRVLTSTPLPEWTAALETGGEPPSLALGRLSTGHLGTGNLDTGHLETGKLPPAHLETGSLQTGKLGDRSPVR